MKLRELFDTLVLYHENFRNLHWNSTGENFDNAHKEITTEYYEMLDGTIDTIGEMLTRLGVNPPNYKEILDELTSSSCKCMMVESQKLYCRTEIIQMSEVMLTDISQLLADSIISEEMKDPLNAGMRSELETILNSYDIQARYINKRRCDEAACHAEFHATHPEVPADVPAAVVPASAPAAATVVAMDSEDDGEDIAIDTPVDDILQ